MEVLQVINWIGKYIRGAFSLLGSGGGYGAGGHGGVTRTETEGVNGPPGAEGKFGRMFDLDPLNVPSAKLSQLAAAMRDDDNNPSRDSSIPAGYTYFGQFVDHDITLDTTTLSEVQIDPSSVFNFRSPKLELDNVYGSGPEISNFLYDNKGKGPKLLLGETDASRPLDLPRMPNGVAVIGDKRNDENLAVSQMQYAWLRFHNAVVDKVQADEPALTDHEVFAKARQTVVWHYQWIVLHDFLPKLVRQSVLDDVLQNGRKFYKESGQGAYIPVEFSVAAYRLGHSMVRNNYDWNKNFPSATLAQLFQFSGLSGFITKQSDIWIADWRRMFDLEAPSGFTLNHTRALDPLLAAELHTLPGGAGSLPDLNLRRGQSVGLPSGQAIANAMNLPSSDRLQPADFDGPDGAVAQQLGLDSATPLWYYILKEAQVQENGERLGAVGSRILSEVFVGLLQMDALSFMSQDANWKPTLPAEQADHFTMADMLRFSGNVNPLENG